MVTEKGLGAVEVGVKRADDGARDAGRRVTAPLILISLISRRRGCQAR